MNEQELSGEYDGPKWKEFRERLEESWKKAKTQHSSFG